MFKTQIEQLTRTFEGLCDEIEDIETSLRGKKEEMRDVKQAIMSLERIQAKYEDKNVEVMEESTNE